MPELRIETDRLILRSFESGDMEALYLLLRDRVYQKYWNLSDTHFVEENIS